MDDDSESRKSETFAESWWTWISEKLVWIASDEALPYLDASTFIISCFYLFMTINTCPVCVFGLLLVSMVLCCRLRFMFIILWACIFVLWVHEWRFGGGKGLSLQWN
jgi:hypothetical protein